MSFACRASLLALLIAATISPAWAASPSVDLADARDQARDAGSDSVRGQPVTLEAGTGVLLSLPRAAASILSAEPSIARVQPASPTSLFLMGVAVGHTTVIATSASGAPIVQYDVSVTPQGGMAAPASQLLGPLPAGAGDHDQVSAGTAAEIEKAIRRTVPGGGSVTAVPIGDRLFLGGTVANPDAGQRAEAIAHSFLPSPGSVVAQFTVLSSAQVNVRVRYAEISRTIERQLGFNWQALGSGGAWRYGTMVNSGVAANTSVSSAINLGGISGTATGLAAASLDPRLPLNLASSPDQIGLGYVSGAWDINGIIDALATDQLVTILAEPNLTAQSGEPASFLAGGEFPIPVAGSTGNGATTVTVEFKQFGVSLEVVPTVLSSGRLNLRVRPEVSQLTSTGSVSVPVGNGTLTIPALTVRRAETTVELGSGQSFAIAGLLQKNTSDAATTMPGAGDLPVIGALFKSDTFQRGESELVIIVTPYLVKPAPGPSALATPIDNFKPATDLDRILLGRQVAGPTGTPLNAGFILK